MSEVTDADVRARVDHLLAEHGDDDDDRVPRRPVRRRAGPHGLPGRATAASTPSPKLQEIVDEALEKRRPSLPVDAQRHGHRHVRPDDRRPRHRGAAASASSARSSPPRRSGASCSASRAPAPTSPGSPTRAVARRRRVDRERLEDLDVDRPTWRASGSCWPAPIPTRRSTRASPMFIVDMHQPGVEVRPIRSMAGASGFNEVFFTDARRARRDARRRRRRGLARRQRHADERAGVDRQRGRAAGLGSDRRRGRRVAGVRRPDARRPRTG